MRHLEVVLFLIWSTLTCVQIKAQVNPADEYLLRVNIPAEMLKDTTFVYGITAEDVTISELHYTLVRTYSVIFQSNTGTNTPKPGLRFPVAFYGFKPAAISGANQIISRPHHPDQPSYLHTMLADIILDGQHTLEYENPKKIILVIYNLTRDTVLRKVLLKDKLITPDMPPWLFLVWNKKPDISLPTLFQTGTCLMIDPAQPMAHFSQPVSNFSAPAKNVRTPDAKEQVAAKKTDPLKGLMPEFIPEVNAFLEKKRVDSSFKFHKCALSEKNDLLFLYMENGKDTVSYPVPIRTKTYSVKLIPVDPGRTPGAMDPEILLISKRKRSELVFSYHDIPLVYHKDAGLISVPLCFTPGKISIKGIHCRCIRTEINEKAETHDILVLESHFPTYGCRLKVVDQSLNNDIGIFKLFLALINNGKTIIYSELFNSGDTLKGLYDDPDIRYQLFLSHPDYIKPQPVFLPDQISGGTCLVKLERANTFNLFYVDFSGRSKMALKKVLKKRVEEMTLHHQKFYMIVCNGNSPLEIRDDKEFAAFSSNIGKFYSDPPDPVFMDQWIRTTLDLETIPKDAIFNVNLFLAGQTYRQSGQKIRDGLTSFLDFFSIDPNVIFYLDETIPDKEKITGSLYYNIARITETN